VTQLLLASGNPGKVLEMRHLLAQLKLELIEPSSLGIQLQVEETTDSYLENARRKALAHAQASGIWSLADDSGLEAEALEGLPGPISARIAGPGASDGDRRKALQKMLVPHPQPWLAHFQCAVALASPAGDLDFSEGWCEGEIILEERGTNGFGYDPIFLVSGTGKTMAELTLEEKNRTSHRARAVSKLIPIIIQRLGVE
jgi:XTP/dITP diphosphohydrolase